MDSDFRQVLGGGGICVGLRVRVRWGFGHLRVRVDVRVRVRVRMRVLRALARLCSGQAKVDVQRLLPVGAALFQLHRQLPGIIRTYDMLSHITHIPYDVRVLYICNELCI